jgi:hypothetical protein
MALTDNKAKNAKPGKHGDGLGHVLVGEAGRRQVLALKYRFAGKEKLLALGVYSGVGLMDARAKREEARAKLANGIDPAAKHRSEKLLRRYNADNTFKSMGAGVVRKPQSEVVQSPRRRRHGAPRAPAVSQARYRPYRHRGRP